MAGAGCRHSASACAPCAHGLGSLTELVTGRREQVAPSTRTRRTCARSLLMKKRRGRKSSPSSRAALVTFRRQTSTAFSRIGRSRAAKPSVSGRTAPSPSSSRRSTHDKSDYGDEEQVDEHRKIFSVTWAKRQGYQVATQLVGQEDDTDCNEGYLINDALPELIKAGKNPTLRLLGSDGRELA